MSGPVFIYKATDSSLGSQLKFWLVLFVI